MQRSDSWIKRCRGRPRQSWQENVELDLRAWHLSDDMIYDRVEWCKKLRTDVED